MSKQNRKVIVKESTGRRLIEQSRVRLLCVGLFFILCFGSITARMVDVAVLSRHKPITITVSDPDNEEKTDQVQLESIEPVLQRGDIVDRNGVLVATSLMTASIFANPKEIKDPQEVAKRLGRALGLNADVLLTRLKSGKSFVWIKRNLNPREQAAANSLGIPGLYFLPEEKRVYPFGNLLSHAVGYVGQDNKGLAGIEKQYDSRLRDLAVNREPLVLSIDVRLQAVLHEETRKAMEEFQAIGATGMILDLHSGELLSMLSLPDFDPNHESKASDDEKFNRATLGSYEMGSTFKSFTIAMAMEHGTASMTSGYDATNPLKIATFTIKDDHPQGRYLTVPEIYAYSSNIGAAKMALDVGTRRQKEFMEKLGMFKQVDIDFPERGLPVYPQDWKEINTVTVAYGHGISVTPLHLVRGIAGIVTGTLPHLTLIKDGNKDKSESERIVSSETAHNICRLMRIVVDYGTGSKADVPGYRVGGKTGTAEKVGAHGGYSSNANLASFVATFPVDDPQYVLLVMLDEPKGDKSTYGNATGGWVSAPVVGNTIARMGPLLGIRPAYDVPDDAQKYWVGNDKPKTRSVAGPLALKQYLHAAAY